MTVRNLVILAATTLLTTACLDSPTEPACDTVQSRVASGDTVTTQSGLTYIVVEEGDTLGAAAELGDSIVVAYAGYLPNGTLFDITQPGLAARFQLNNDIIPGFREGVTGMHIGEVRRLIIPPALAYGPQSPSRCIPPNSTLIFDLQLLGIPG